MDKKLVFLDIDGTLVSSFSSPTRAVTEAIRRTRANGHLVFLCTGRNLAAIGSDILEIGFDGVVASAGAYIAAGGQILRDHLLPEEVVQECLDVFRDLGIFCRIEAPEGVYSAPKVKILAYNTFSDSRDIRLIWIQKVFGWLQKTFGARFTVKKYEEYPQQGAYKLSFTSIGSKPVLEARKILEDRFEFVLFPHGGITLCINGEIIPREVSKGHGIQMMCQHFKAELEDTVAFGDSMNDASMLKCAGVAVAMGNACDELKALADTICECVNQDGVSMELHRMGLC